MSIPIPVQSAYLRDYATRSGLSFSLPVTEVCFNDSYFCLSNLFRRLRDSENFGAVSILCLPLFDDHTFKSLFALVSCLNNVEFHFPLESFRGSARDIQEWRMEFLLMYRYQCKSLSKTNWLE